MSSQTKQDITSCFHCGDLCVTTRIKFDDKSFCCQGCKTVYEILSAHELVEYYEMEKTPGLRKEEKIFSDYSYLDIQKIRDDLLDFSAGGVEKVKFNVPGMHCASCIWLLENLNEINQNISRSEVNFLRKEVSIQYDSGKMSLREVAELLESIGYRPLIELDQKERKTANRRRDLTYAYKLGIAGFAFGNIMLLSFPEYFSEGMYADEQFGAFFGYINLILGLPVFFYCSSSYFISAWKGIKHRYLNIDVPIALGILVLFIRSTYEVLTSIGPGYFDSMTGLVFFLLVGRWFQNRTYQALSFERDYKSYFPLGVTKVSDSGEENVLLKDIEIGDTIAIHYGEIIPADSSLLSDSAEIDYSFVTGEAVPVQTKKEEKLFAGGRQLGEKIHVKVEKEFSQSYLMQLWKQEEKENQDNRDLSRTIDKVSQYFTFAILTIAFGSMIYWYFKDASLAFHAFSSVLIIACPCALALTIPFTYGNGLKILEKAGIYLRDSRFIEIFSGVGEIVFDKTGTITAQKNKAVSYEGTDLSEMECEMVASLAKNSTHPLSRMIYSSLELSGNKKVSSYKELPGQGIEGIVDGTEIKLGSAEYLGIDENSDKTSVYISMNNKHFGRFSLENEYRSGLEDVSAKLGYKYRMHVITGDGEGEKTNLQKIFGPETDLSFKMNPFEKREYVESIKLSGKKVMMIGDGLNDAGAIKSSDVGVSISDDIFGFLPSCDAILEASSFEKIPDLLNYSKTLRKLVIAGFGISFSYNIIGLSFAVQGVLSPVVAAILMPLSSISVVAFAIFSTGLAARKNNIF